MDSWRYAKDRPPARVSLMLEERLLGGPVGGPVASGPVSTLLRRYKGPDQDLAAALERCAIGLPHCWLRCHLFLQQFKMRQAANRAKKGQLPQIPDQPEY